MSPVTVRKLGLWWLWYCQIPTCLDHAGHGHGYDLYLTPAAAADAGRAHHHLWHTGPAAGYEPEDANVDDWTPTAETGLHVVRPQATHGSLPVDGGDEDMAGMAGATGGHDDTLPVCGTCDGSGVLPAHLQQLDRNQDPDPACLKGTLP